jgi:hypothetical protein
MGRSRYDDPSFFARYQGMREAGLTLTGIDEPYPDDELPARRPELADHHRRRPPLLVIRARKPA